MNNDYSVPVVLHKTENWYYPSILTYIEGNHRHG
jgi:hypothetical protein